MNEKYERIAMLRRQREGTMNDSQLLTGSAREQLATVLKRQYAILQDRIDQCHIKIEMDLQARNYQSVASLTQVILAYDNRQGQLCSIAEDLSLEPLRKEE